ncbi:hypothetical protein [Bradyrhizobium sp. AS23.2]|uniref:hypothetical protein n=1 Tax=Bradyrhizobium sp. AS23.2 TaxID=1680155 RepID=UPI00093AC098|nr:hypothetical protein [Bradyrhizobium sp. AS23.2]OKO79811.1 hypothetical protein AC630_16715 [Bradyrhizobium sp. AS23.2]
MRQVYELNTATPMRSHPRPYTPEDPNPLTWWRMLPPHFFRNTERLLLRATLKNLAIIGGGKDVAAALEGDPAAAVKVALSLIPLRELTLPADISMTALLSCTLNGDRASGLVMSHILGRTQWGDPGTEMLGLAWLDRHIAHPIEHFAAIEAALAAAFAREAPQA